MLGVLLGLVFLWKHSHMFPSCYGGKYLKEGGRMKQAHVLYPLWLFPPPRVLSSLNLFARPSGFLYLQIVALHWDACFFEVGLLFKFRVHLSPRSTCMQCKYFSRQCCLISANSDHLTQRCKIHSLFLFTGLAHALNFTCEVSWMLLAKM